MAWHGTCQMAPTLSNFSLWEETGEPGVSALATMFVKSVHPQCIRRHFTVFKTYLKSKKLIAVKVTPSNDKAQPMYVIVLKTASCRPGIFSLKLGSLKLTYISQFVYES